MLKTQKLQNVKIYSLNLSWLDMYLRDSVYLLP